MNPYHENAGPIERPKTTLERIELMLHTVAYLDEGLGALGSLVALNEAATQLFKSGETALSDFDKFKNLVLGQKQLLQTMSLNVDNEKLSDAEFRLFIKNCLKED